MAARGEVDVHGFWVLLGRAGSEPLPSARSDLYRWMGKQLRPGRKIALRGPTQSKSLSFEQVQRNASCIRDLLLEKKIASNDAVAIIDLSETPYDLLREPLLLYVGETAMELARKPERTVVIALPGKAPASNSLLWVGLGRSGERPPGSIFVIDQSGRVDSVGAETEPPEELSGGYRKQASSLDAKTEDRLKAKLLRRLGHFDLAALGGREQICSHYLYDAENCVDELATLIERRMSSLTGKRRNEKYMLVPCSGRSDWLTEAAMLAGDRIGVKVGRWPTRPTRRTPKELKGKRLVLLFDIVRSGATARAALERAIAWEGVQVKVAYAAIGPHKPLNDLPGGLKLSVAERRTLERVPRGSCPQCELGLDFTPPGRGEEHHQLRAFDLWSMLLGVDWIEEPYGPDNTELFKSSPDFGEVFEKYGDFLAYRYELALAAFDDNEIIVVSPDEPAVGELLRRLKARFDDRLVLIAVPRKPILESVRRDGSEANVKELLRRHRAQPWARQLTNVRERDESVVMVDEFNASGTTARAMANLLRGSHVEITGFLPVVDRKPKVDLGVQVRPLYEIPRPRQ